MEYKKIKIKSESSVFTKKIAKVIAGLLCNSNFSDLKNAKVILLKGDLGSGKTTFAKGFLSFFGIKVLSASPTFILIKKYDLSDNKKCKNIKNIYHIDSYRIVGNANEIENIGINKILKDNNSILLVEWPENLNNVNFGKNVVNINFEYGCKKNERNIIIYKK